ncbi:MAG: DUF4270 family protein [Flavobacteriales bacterium]|nr:DUF4270 family protein [Flavobacteriales bacterium]
MTLNHFHQILLRKVVLLSVVFILIQTSCKKDGELYPSFNEENLTTIFTDTSTIFTTTIKDDSVQTDIAGTNLLGIYHDSLMGIASSSFYTELTLAGSNVNFGNNAVIDSVVLTMKYLENTAFYGSLLDPMSVEVYRLSEKFTKSEYYAYDTLSYSSYPTPIGSLTFQPYLNDSVSVILSGDTIKQAPHLRILLDNTFGQEIIDAGNNSNIITSNSVFNDLVNGLYITTSTTVNNTTLSKGQGAIISFDMNSTLSTVTLYYHNDQSTDKSYSFIINSESKKFNRFAHNYTNTDVEKHLTGFGFDSTVTYVQALGGLKTKIEIPFIKNLGKDNRIIINKAELVLTINEGSNSNYKALNNVALAGIDATGESVFLIDYFEGSTYFGGTFDEVTNTYKFNIARHLQSLITNNTTDYGYYLVASGSSVNANRSIINSFNHPSNKLKLNITYSKY